MRLVDCFRPPRHVLAIFLSVAAVCAGALGWLGWLLLEQDNAVEAQRRREYLDQAGDRAVAVMQRSIADLESLLGSGSMAPPPGVLLISAGPAGIVAQPRRGLLYYPTQPSAPEPLSQIFGEAERLEFGRNDPAAAALLYARMAGSADAAVRAGALTRLARCHRKLHDTAAALREYDRLAPLADIVVDGIPAGLVAREGRASLFQETQRSADLLREAAALQSDLREGRWQLLKQQYEFYAAEAAQWLGKAPSMDEEALARTEAFDWLWQNRAAVERSGRRFAGALVVWKTSTDQLLAAIAGPEYVNRMCREAIPGTSLAWALTDIEGRGILGAATPAREAAVHTAAVTRLPWTLHLFAPLAVPGAHSPRRQLLLWVFAVLAIVLSAGTYFILRAITREQHVARLQSDFVAAVSHEFRSPLSSLSQISEMLVRDRFPSDELRRKSYDILARETGRLRSLVEGLLDFGRFEAGASVYRFETLEVGAFLRALIADFQERVARDGYSIELSIPEGELYISADREALARAIWNLLDNAVKYSPESHTVWVEVEVGHALACPCISIAIRDRGLGIPAHEQREIFEKFVRGAESKALRIKGTGIGLALVRRIVQAHGGEISLASEPGQGSRFTMILRAAGGVS